MLRNSGSRGKGVKRRLLPPPASSDLVRAVMRGNRSEDTGPEVILRSGLWKAKVRGYRKHPKFLPGRPDIAFLRQRVAVFVHGCFWHCCPKCRISKPRSNLAYWQEKLGRNQSRDIIVFKRLVKQGWRPLRLWECEIRNSLARCVSQVSDVLHQAMSQHPKECHQ